MSRKFSCRACTNEKFGVKTRIAVEHTCGKENQKEHETVHGNEAEKRVCKKCNVNLKHYEGHYCTSCLIDIIA